MTKAARCELVQGATRIIFEYVRARGVLRLTGNPNTVMQWGPMEMSFAELVRLLQIDVTPLVPEQPFMVFGGALGLGGSKDFIGAFSTEREAREHFVALRQGPALWAEVVTLSKGKLRQVCWFGNAVESQPVSERRWWRR